MTNFQVVYDSFLSKITDDMYCNWELTKQDTIGMLQELLLEAIPFFEFPKVNINDYVCEERIKTEDITESDFIDFDDAAEEVKPAPGHFNVDLTNEEVSILSTYMVVIWLGQQLASIENTRMKYSSSDFKMTSQANHMKAISSLKKDYEREGFHLQRLYSRRRIDENGRTRSTFDRIMFPEG